MVWPGKVLVQVVESILVVWEELGSSPMYANFCAIVLLFKLWSHVLVWYDVWIGYVKHETWIDMMVWYWFGNRMVMGSCLGELTLNFIFWHFWIWFEYEKVERKTLVVWQLRGGWKIALRSWWMTLKHHLIINFRSRAFS